MQDLHFLIKSLTANEKRYVTIYINRFSTTKTNYSILYQAVEKQNIYEEEEIEKKLRKEPFIKHLAVTKHYLFQLILNSMREYYDEQFMDWQLRNQLAQIFVLTSKGLDKAAHKLILKTKQACWQYENYIVLLEILGHERFLFGNRRIKINQADYGKIVCDEEIKVVEIVQQLATYKKIWHTINYYELIQNNYTKQELIVALKNEINIENIEPPKHKTFLLKAQYHNTVAHYCLLINDINTQLLHNKKVVELREEQLLAQPLSQIDLFATYYNFMLACYNNKQWNFLKIYLEKTQQLETKSIEKKIKFFHDYYYCALLYNLGTENYEKGYALTKEIETGINTYNGKLRQDFLIWLWQCSGLICFFSKRYKEAYKWWQPIILLEKYNVEIKKRCAVELYVIMLHIEENNIDVLDYQTKQLQNKLVEHNLFDDAEKILISFFKSFYKNGKANKTEYKDLKIQIETKIADNKFSIIDEHLLKWLENKAK